MILYEQIDKPMYIHCGHQKNGNYDCKMRIAKGTVTEHWAKYHPGELKETRYDTRTRP